MKNPRIFGVVCEIRSAHHHIQVTDYAACFALLVHLYKTVYERSSENGLESKLPLNSLT